jgi:hypothetical protein
MRFILVLCIVLIASPAYAEVNLMVTGNDYAFMSDGQKIELVSAFYKIFKVNEAPEDGIMALDAFYFGYSDRPTARDAEVIMKAPVMKILANILTYSPDKDFAKELADLNR